MSNKDLIEDLNHLRIRYGTTNIYRTLMKQMRDEFEELSSIFGVSSNTHPTSTFFATSPENYYAEFMKASAEAAHDVLQEQHPVFPTSFYDEDASIEAQSIHGDEFSLCPEEEEDNIEDMDLLQQILKDISYSASTKSSSTEISPETPRGETANTHEEPPLKIIQTGGAGAAPDTTPKKRLLKKKSPDSTVSVVKESTAPTKGKKTKST